MATLKNKRKLAAVSREAPESTRNSRAQNTLDPESAQDYISQVSEEIEGRVTKKLSKEFSRTESRILGALSKLDEFLLNPRVRACSVAVPGTSRNNNSENRETTGDRSSDDHCPEVRYSSHHSGHLNSPEVEEYPHSAQSKSGIFVSWKKPKFILRNMWRCIVLYQSTSNLLFKMEYRAINYLLIALGGHAWLTEMHNNCTILPNINSLPSMTPSEYSFGELFDSIACQSSVGVNANGNCPVR